MAAASFGAALVLPTWLSTLRFVLGGSLSVLGAFCVGLNWVTIPWNYRPQRMGVDRHVSGVPIIGPILICFGAALASWPPTPHVLWSWLLDWPTVLIPLYVWRSK